MKDLNFKALSKAEKELVLAARPKKLRKLDEDELLQLHKRARRARNKYATLLRRRAADTVEADRARGKAARKHARVAAKAETFEDVLARVSRRLAVVARRSSDELRDRRLAAANPTDDRPPQHTPSRGDHPAPPGSQRGREQAPIEKRRVAGERSSKRRHEARRG